MADNQLPLFEVGPAPQTETQDLIVHARPSRPLTKEQKEFNKLVTRVEALRERLDQETRLLDEALVYHSKHLAPKIQRHHELREQVVCVLAASLNDKRLKKHERNRLADIIRDQLEAVGEHGPIENPDLLAIFEQVHGITYAEAQKQDIEITREIAEAMFGDLGVDIDLSDVFDNDPDIDPFQAAAEKAAEQLRQRAAEDEQRKARQAQRPKTEKQRAKEERQRQAEELRKKSMTSLYRDLAKALHPDLEQDPEARQQKQTLMQELTAAYRNNDLHTLLRLELAWIRRETGNIERLTKERLAIYNKVLREQAQELEDEITELVFHPKYEPLGRNGPPPGAHLKATGAAQARVFDQAIRGLEDFLKDMHKGDPLGEIRAMVRSYREMQRDF